MEIWIRSQSKEFLGTCNRLMVWKTSECKDEQWALINQHMFSYEADDYTTLGIYTSKERALEILEDIHKTIIDILPNNLNAYLEVYQMPKE